MTACNSLAKLAALLVAISVCAGALVYVPHSRAADTPNEWIEPIAGAPSAIFYDVEWTPDGEWAMWVGSWGGLAVAYWYEAATGAWIQSLCISGIETTYFTTAVYFPSHPSWNPGFMLLGSSGANGAYYVTDIYSKANMAEYYDPTIANFVVQGAKYNPHTTGQATIVAVGLKTSNGAYCYEYGMVNEDWGVTYKCRDIRTNNAVWRDIEFDTTETPADIYLVGYDGTGTAAMLHVWDSSASQLLSKNVPAEMNDIYDIAFDDSAVPAQMVVSIYSTVLPDRLWKLTKATHFDVFEPLGDGYGIWANSQHKEIMSLDFDELGRGIAAGYWMPEGDDVGFIADIWRDGSDYTIVSRSTLAPPFTNLLLSCNDVAIIPVGNPRALIAGSAFVYHYTAASSNIQVDTLFPHIDYIDLRDDGGFASRLNGQIDVDPGDDSTWYDLNVHAWHNSGQLNIVQMDAYLWYDGGADETMPVPFEVGGWENNRIHLQWTRAGGFSLIYPIWETTFSLARSGWSDDGDTKNVTLAWAFSPHQQVRSASGDMAWSPLGGMFGGGLPQGQSTSAALNDLYSWNICVVVTDSGGATASAYDEFGIYKYTYIGSSGLPGGGNVIGSGPPSTTISLAPSGSNVEYSANCPYQLTIKTTNLIGQNFGGTIPATDIWLQGGIAGSAYFAGPGAPIYLYGSIAPTYQSPYPSNRVTYLTWQGGLPLTLYCDVPSVAEDYYKGTLTYSLLHG